MGICSGISTEWLFFHCFRVEWTSFHNVTQNCDCLNVLFIKTKVQLHESIYRTELVIM